MSKTKDYLIGLQEAEAFKELVESPITHHKFPEPEFEEEVYEIRKGEYVSEIVCRFNSKGYLVSTQTNSKPITGDIEYQIMKLETFISQAVALKDFRAADKMQKQIDTLKNQQGA
jgi:hypothetical protein